MTREERKSHLKKTADELNNSSDECLLAVTELHAMELEDENAQLRARLEKAEAVCEAAKKLLAHTESYDLTFITGDNGGMYMADARLRKAVAKWEKSK